MMLKMFYDMLMLIMLVEWIKRESLQLPNAQVYIGNEEEQYLTGKMYRMKELGFWKLKVGVSLKMIINYYGW